MASVDLITRLTANDLLRHPESDRYELVDGELVDIPMGAESSSIGAALVYLLFKFVSDRKLGQVFGSDCGYQCFLDDADKVRKPDVSFVRRDRFADGVIPKGYLRVAPDLAVEVVSPGDGMYDVTHKAGEYLKAGVPLVWIVNPEDRTVLVYRKEGSIVGLREVDELSGESVLPGFRCQVSELFPQPEATTP